MLTVIDAQRDFRKKVRELYCFLPWETNSSTVATVSQKFFGEGKFGEMLKVDIKLMAEIITKDGVRSNLKLKIL